LGRLGAPVAQCVPRADSRAPADPLEFGCSGI